MKTLHLSLVLYFLLFSPLSRASGLDRMSYGELAAHTIGSGWARMNHGLQAIHEESLPHEAKDARKQIAALKEQLDLFAYAYPSEPQDLWEKIRNDLDEGYEKFGNFKDLYDAQGIEDSDEAEYDPTEVETTRKKVLKWIRNWNEKSYQYGSYLASPALIFYFRPKKSLSRFYWGATDLVPQHSLTGLENLASLSQALRDAAISDWKLVRKLVDPAESSEAEIAFHDFRKRIRSLARILRTFPSIYLGTEAALSEVEELASRYGDLHDKIVAHEKASTAGKKKRASRLHEEILNGWNELLRMQEDRGIKSLLRSIAIS